MERDGAIKKDKKKIMINRKGQEYQNRETPYETWQDYFQDLQIF